MVEWRGEDDSNAHELEEIFREIIVIDDDHENTDSESSDSDGGNLQIISSLQGVHEMSSDDDEQIMYSGNQSHHQQDGRLPQRKTVYSTVAPGRAQEHDRSPPQRQEFVRNLYEDRHHAAQAHEAEHSRLPDKSSISIRPVMRPEYANHAQWERPSLKYGPIFSVANLKLTHISQSTCSSSRR